MCMSVCLRVCLCTICGPEEAPDPLKLELQTAASSHECWGMNQGPLQEQPAFFVNYGPLYPAPVGLFNAATRRSVVISHSCLMTGDAK